MRAFATQTFNKALKKLAKKRNHYRNIKSDLGAFLNGCADASELLKMGKPIVVQDSDDRNVITKTRFGNSGSSSGKRGAHRFISAIDIAKDAVLLLYVYPKTGPEKRDDLTDSEIEELTDSAFEDGIVQMRLVPELAVIEAN